MADEKTYEEKQAEKEKVFLTAIEDLKKEAGILNLKTSEGQTKFERITEELKKSVDEQKTEMEKMRQESLNLKETMVSQLRPAQETKDAPDDEVKVNDHAMNQIVQVMRYRALQIKGATSQDLAMIEPKFKEVTYYDVNHEKKTMYTDSLFRSGALSMPARHMDEIIDVARVQTSDVRSRARTMRIPEDTVEYVRQDAHSASRWTNEHGAAVEDTAAKFGAVTIPLHPYQNKWIASTKMLRNSRIDLRSFMTQDVGVSLQYLHGTGYISGTGVGEPKGFMSNTSVSHVAVGEASTITTTAFINRAFLEGIKAVYSNDPSAAWAMNSVTLSKLTLINDSTGRPILFNLNGTPEFTLMGKPIVRWEGMPNVGAGLAPIIFAAWSQFYMVVDSVETSVLIDPFTAADNNLVKFYTNGSTGGDVLNPEAAVKVIVEVS
jgi:HK97 family phage major capsid protein